MKYKKVDEIDVLDAFGNIEVIGQWYIPKVLVANFLCTSLYQVNKHCKSLIKQGLLEAIKCEAFHDIDYESGIDYGNSLTTTITQITNKGIDCLKSLNRYQSRWYEDLLKEKQNETTI